MCNCCFLTDCGFSFALVIPLSNEILRDPIIELLLLPEASNTEKSPTSLSLSKITKYFKSFLMPSYQDASWFPSL